MTRVTISYTYPNGDELLHLPAGAFDYDGSCQVCGKYRVGFYGYMQAVGGFIGYRQACSVKHARKVWAAELEEPALN